jgi:hypothetical protein
MFPIRSFNKKLASKLRRDIYLYGVCFVEIITINEKLNLRQVTYKHPSKMIYDLETRQFKAIE